LPDEGLVSLAIAKYEKSLIEFKAGRDLASSEDQPE